MIDQHSHGATVSRLRYQLKTRGQAQATYFKARELRRTHALWGGVNHNSERPNPDNPEWVEANNLMMMAHEQDLNS